MHRKLFERIRSFFKWLLTQLKDKTNIAIFIAVLLVMSSVIWVPYLIAIITGIKWWWAIGSACWAFWLAPFTPFFPLCIAVTAVVRKIYDRIRRKKDKE